MMTRAEWEKEHAERQQRLGLHGFNPGMPWSVAYWHERIGIVLFYVFLWCVVGPVCFVVCFFGPIWVVGMAIENIGQHRVEHERCLKAATNGWEIKQCR